MYSRMLPQSRGNAIWIAHPDVMPQIVALSRAIGTGGSAVMMSNMAGSAPASLYGRPLILSEKCQTLGTAGDIFFVDLSYYVVADRQSLSMASSPHVRFQNDETVWRFTSRLDGRPWLESALTPRNGSNTISPFVNLATRS
jgi:HK97 family phage major capsid protein